MTVEGICYTEDGQDIGAVMGLASLLTYISRPAFYVADNCLSAVLNINVLHSCRALSVSPPAPKNEKACHHDKTRAQNHCWGQGFGENENAQCDPE